MGWFSRTSCKSLFRSFQVFFIWFCAGNPLQLCGEIPGHADRQQVEHGSAMYPCHKGQLHPSCIMKTLDRRLREVMAPPSPTLMRLHLDGCLWVRWTYWQKSMWNATKACTLRDWIMLYMRNTERAEFV